MTGSVQSVDVSVIGKKTGVSKFGVGSEVSLKEASVVQLNVTRADVKGLVRQGDDLLITLSSGQVITVQGYFLEFEGSRSNLVLDDELEGLWVLNLGDGAEAGPLPYGFSSIQSIDPLLETDADDRGAILGSWHSALAALTLGAILAGGLASNGDSSPHKPASPDVNPINGVDPITGTAEPGSTVIVTRPDGTTVTGIADADGHFSIPNPGLQHDEQLTVVAQSPEGVDSDPVTVTVDALAPEAPTVDPVNANDPIVGHAEPGSTVTITLEDGTTYTAVAGEDGKFEINIPQLEDGDRITVTATDTAGNVSEPVEMIVDGVAPTLVITDDVTGIVGDGGVVTFTFTFNEDVKDFDASKIQIEGGVAGELVAVSGSVYTLVVTPNATENGEIKITVPEGAAHDAAGNPSAAAEATQQVDTVAPGADALHDLVLMDDVGAVTGQIKAGDQTDDTQPTYSGKADPANVAVVQILDNGKVIGEAVVEADGSWSFEPKLPMASGPHSFQARPVDAAGNVGEATEALPFNLFGPAPAAPAITDVRDDVGTITGNIQKGYPTDDSKPTLEGTATPGTIVKVWDGDVLVGSAETNADGNWVIETQALGDGEHKLVATATDGAGQVSPPTGEYLVLVDTTPPGKPLAPTATGNEGDSAGPDSTILTVTTDTPVLSGIGEPGETATIYDNGVAIGTATVNQDGVWTYVPADELPQGSHDIAVTLTDQAGNTSTGSDPLALIVDTSKEPLRILRALDDVGPLTDPVSNGGATDDATPTLEGKAPAGVTVTVYEGTMALGTAVANENGAWSLALAEQSEGLHTYTAKAVNEAGTPLQAEFKLTIDVTAPQTPSIDGAVDDVGSN